MAYRRDGSTLRVLADPSAVERIRLISRRAGIACAVVACWAAIWFGLMLALGGDLLGMDDPRETFRLVGAIGLGVAAVVGVGAVVLLTRARRLAHQVPPVLQVGPEAITSPGQQPVALDQVSHVVTSQGRRPTHWAPSRGGTAGNELGHRLVGTPDHTLLVEVRRRSGSPLRVNLALHVPVDEFAPLVTDLHAVLGQLGIPVTADDGPPSGR